MIDLTKITPEQANKIECALLMMDSHIKEIIHTYETAATWSDLSEKARQTMKSNAEWWKDLYQLLNGELPD